MSLWKRWVQQPQNVLLRRALFQIHLWTGIGCGLYVLLISVSGSALVYRRELSKAFSHEPVITAVPGGRLTPEQLQQAVELAYPQYRVIQIFTARNPTLADDGDLVRNGEKKERLFDPSAAAEVGICM